MRAADRMRVEEAAADLRAALDLIDVGSYDKAAVRVQIALEELSHLARDRNVGQVAP